MAVKQTDQYNHREIELKWEKKWEEQGIYKAIDFDSRPKKYTLFEFPYPSGERLHIGHAFSFIGTDVLARFFRMNGFNVLCPMGWDAFGLPAENYAIKTGINPMITTSENINNSKVQAKRWGLSIDWEREVATTDPDYYKWTQWIFLQWYKKGLAYKSQMPINWCPACKIGLANEEVVDGKCERCGAETSRRTINQWVVKITDYADRLIEGLKNTDFIEKVKASQINWIGRSEGALIKFTISNLSPQMRDPAVAGQFTNNKEENFIEVFTTRPDTLYGATFMVLSPEHPLISKVSEPKVREYVKQAAKKSEMERTELSKEKTGVFSGLYAINPVTNKAIPIWISDFVLASYGTGAIMAVPAHDQRDWDFAHKFGLPIVPTIEPPQGWDFDNQAYTEVDKGQTINSPNWNGISPSQAINKAILWLKENKLGEKSVSYHLRDWIFSRQHYWGEPIPIIYCEKCGEVLVPEEDLPVKLPQVENYQPTETGESPLALVKDWVNTACPKCGGPAKRETDTMPNWAGSDWYYLAYPLADKIKKFEIRSTNLETNTKSQNINSKQKSFGNSDFDIRISKNIFSENKDILSYWLPVDIYIGGDEHNTLHLLYSRFTYQFLGDIGVVPKDKPEPYFKRLSHGVILGPDNQRMSKSRGNIINPDSIVEAFGADSLRMYLMFMGPFDFTMAWNQESLEGCSRFLKRVWNLFDCQQKTSTDNPALVRKLNQTIKKVGEDIAEMKFNTAIAGLMELLNQISGQNLSQEFLEKFLLILAPFAPHLTEELWQKIAKEFSIHNQPWPEFDPNQLEEEVLTIAVQVNGKLRATIEINQPDSTQQEIAETKAKELEKIKLLLGDQAIKKVIFVPKKLINFVI